MEEKTKLYTTKQVAKMLDLNVSRITVIANQEGVGNKMGWQWLFTEADVQRMKNRNTKPGKKKKQEAEKENA